ncbi:GTP-binding protein, putative [Trypanosoma cruzi marinkellei]|uniref:Guanine nucleotide-binding protein-like 1 n=1 Tax=Trypanosoma cruzi marinkellei TaxID=85056 RepID=K2PCM4_TRYCR|nr:GTP-binding protein, putative [Trypanosoma cruzi marinkellei]
MDENGIPFGSWFNMPGHNTDAAWMPFAVEMPTRGCVLNEVTLEENNTQHDDNIHRQTKDEIVFESVSLESREVEHFELYLKAVDNYSLPSALQTLQLNSYERNLDVWRQLWRTVEQSDVVLIVCDVRYPILHLPLSLLHYIVRQCKKSPLVLLNKADLVPRHVLDKWMEFLPLYFKATGVVSADEAEAASTGVVCDIPLLPFTSLPVEETAFGAEGNGNPTRRRKKKKRHAKLYEQLRTGKLQLPETSTSDEYDEDEDACGGSSQDEEENHKSGRVKGDGEYMYAETDNFKGMQKAERELTCDKREYNELQIVSDMISLLLQKCRAMCANKTHVTCSTGGEGRGGEEAFLRIGVVGHPNVGKSSLLNCIRGTKVVSVSATPGHTKHLQTIPIPSEQVMLIDSPGLAFPVFGLPRAIQAVVGTHQIAQTRDPQSGVAFLASHLQIERLYGLRKVDGADDTLEWSPYELCESYAKKKGYFVKHGKGALDVHRGAIEILQEAYDGRLVLFFAPPDPMWLESSQFRKEICPYLLMELHLPGTVNA